jgi:hypothetical protein
MKPFHVRLPLSLPPAASAQDIEKAIEEVITEHEADFAPALHDWAQAEDYRGEFQEGTLRVVAVDLEDGNTASMVYVEFECYADHPCRDQSWAEILDREWEFEITDSELFVYADKPLLRDDRDDEI